MDNEILIRFLLAAVWGGIVGLEREYRSKVAGFRTMIMISIGSCFFTMMSLLIGGSNPDRIASNIVTGIGFLGAGVIFRGESRVQGITTAASIWTVAAVGMGIGAGYYMASASASVLVLIVLAILPRIEQRINKISQYRTYKVQCSYTPTVKQEFGELLEHSKLKCVLMAEIKDDNRLTLTWQAHGHIRDHQMLVELLTSNDKVERFEY